VEILHLTINVAFKRFLISMKLIKELPGRKRIVRQGLNLLLQSHLWKLE
jgi:hypothetical protein